MKRAPAPPTPGRRTASMRIDIADRQPFLHVSRARIRAAVRHTLRAERVTEAEISVALVDDATMRRIHREFFGLDSATDVITFPYRAPPQPLSGEIVVSVETARRAAPRHRTSPEREVILYVIHGVLHLCGYLDHRAGEARKMRRRQQRLLNQVAGTGDPVRPRGRFVHRKN